jgi:hypothetical protein
LRNLYSFLLLLSFFMVALDAKAQDLGAIGSREKPVRFSGGVSASQIAYAASGMQNRRDPYTYFLSGNLAMDLYGWSVPVSFNFSNQRFAFQQPFNQYGLHPTYKWVTGHLGWASMSFSPYTLSGHLFRGAGVELKPDNGLVFSAMWGRLQKATNPLRDSLAFVGQQPAFQRMGWGFKGGYQKGGDEVFFSLFSAQDRQQSLFEWVADSFALAPEENLVMSLSGQKQLFQKLSLSAEWATTALTRDSRQGPAEARGVFRATDFLMPANASTQYYKALKSALTYSGSFYTLGMAYERVDPGYQTLGAYYFNNDLESLSLTSTTALAGGRVNLGLNVGSQRDNLDDDKVSSMRRLASSLSVAWAAGERLNLNAAYSNFQTITNIQPLFQQLNQLTPYENLDTLNYTQLSRSTNLSANYLLSTLQERRQSLSMNLSMQQAADRQGNDTPFGGSQFYNANGVYSLSLAPQQLTLSAAFNYSLNKMDTIGAATLGPSLTASKSLLDKTLRTSLSLGFNQSRQQGEVLAQLWNLRASGSYTIQKKHNLNLSLVALNRSAGERQPGFREFTATLGYSLRFGGG